MKKTFRIVLLRMLDADGIRQAREYDLVNADRADPVRRPRPEPEIMGNPLYHRAIFKRNVAAALSQRDGIVNLETEVLLSLAESHRIVKKSRMTHPLLA